MLILKYIPNAISETKLGDALLDLYDEKLLLSNFVALQNIVSVIPKDISFRQSEEYYNIENGITINLLKEIIEECKKNIDVSVKPCVFYHFLLSSTHLI